jgi:hypothetical protein
VVVQYAIAAAGAIAVNCNTRLAAPELRAQLVDAGSRWSSPTTRSRPLSRWGGGGRGSRCCVVGVFFG